MSLSPDDPQTSESSWVDEDDCQSSTQPSPIDNLKPLSQSQSQTLVMVETAFLASTSALIWLINYYFPLGPLLRIFFPIPIALIYLRRGDRAAIMASTVATLLLSVLMGPVRSVIFLIPYGLMGIQLGVFWRRSASWNFSLCVGGIIGTFGVFFRIFLFSIFLGEDLWSYVMVQITELANWIFLKLGILAEPSLGMIELLALVMIYLSNLLYMLTVHLAALLILDKLGNPIPRPPNWIKTILDYD
ncbi:DUF2232 domain-containing protein [Gloeocapsa sp. PCC 73106]|uniref:DUF2232 domain-containing protein n=1 Tax=Gloeocapsa sp. PCC 73106 TaxID=102232 RepID=UPI0002AB9DEE|nr:DUF2232 domain-containing protein [Gloeocapsa sp. PCC 73106]ELR96726.1 putative membrane protein (DUF2232) [Gloeocapsa sp. PCC 73106]